MLPGKRRLKWGIGALAVLLALLLQPLVSRSIFALQMALSLRDLASGGAGPPHAIAETSAHRRFRGQEIEALIYYPSKTAPTRAVILIAGLSEQGCRHPRLVALSRALADKGLMVVAPDIREFRQFQISTEPMEQVLFWYRQIPNIEGGGKVRSTGLAGISFSGTLALMAAARPDVRDSIGFVVAIGPYCNLLRCTREWFASGPDFVAQSYYPTRFYAKWIVMLSALDMIPDPVERHFLKNVLESLLLQRETPDPDPSLSTEGKRWYELATMYEDRENPTLVREIERHLTASVYPQLEPGGRLAEIRCKVFLVHGAYDDLIPARESEELHRKIPGSRLLISPFLTHTHPTDKKLSRAQKFRAAIDTFTFCYRLSRVIR